MKSAKGKSGRFLPLNSELEQVFKAYFNNLDPYPTLDSYVISNERGARMLPCNDSHWFRMMFKSLRLDGCSSHSGRRTVVTNAAKYNRSWRILRDMQQLEEYSSLQMTQSYIEIDTEAKRKVV